ncbi:MAG: 4Fe-4S binding protein [Spirochaetes bacterium]|nr:4Fe-4S binding protein [Spirochaetota bacterium]
MEPGREPLVCTIKEKCRVCYTCVRECPAKAIRISGGQAEVIQERCIGCGNCFRVCTQQAKKVRSSVESVFSLLSGGGATAACLAPSFAAEFCDMDHRVLSGMLRRLGFHRVLEVAFGADLVSQEYRKLVTEKPGSQHIATTCPAIVSYIEKYHPGLVKNLAKIPSPMIATARGAHRIYGDDISLVFIGPCIAKKDEALREDLKGEIAEVLTFIELRQMFESRGIRPEDSDPSEFDPPRPGLGTLYPIGRGMLQSAGLRENLLDNAIFATDGTKQFVHALKEYEAIPHNIQLLELLCCNGCIMGPGMTTKLTHFSRRSSVSRYAQERCSESGERDDPVPDLSGIDMTVSFRQRDLRHPAPPREELRTILEQKGKFNPEDELNCGACGYDTCVEHATAIYLGLAESEMCLPHTIETLKKTAFELKESYEELVEAKNALIQSEKLASLGRMASGIAHEINNPLTGVLTYSSLLLEDLKDTPHADDLETIIRETIRCRTIVRGLLDFARESKHEKERSNLNEIIVNTLQILEKHVNYHKIRIEKDLDPRLPLSLIDVNQMRSVVNNLSENAAHAMPDGGTLTITTRYDDIKDSIVLQIADTGVGISDENLGRIFDPFYTTKKEGKGTGLGLAVTFGIVKRHHGTIEVKSAHGTGTTFTITIPVSLLHD